MSDPLRIFLRVVGLVLFVGGLLGVLYIVSIGPDQVGESMGRECKHNEVLGPADQCTWQDVLGIMQALPWITLIGGVLMILMRPEKAETSTRFSGLRTAGTAAVIGIVVVNLVGVFIYRHAYRVNHMVEVVKKIDRETDKANAERNNPEIKPADADAPRGLAKGSLLEEDAFTKAMGEIRRAAPAGASLSGLYVSAERVEADVISDGKVTKIRRAWDGKATVVDDRGGRGARHEAHLVRASSIPPPLSASRWRRRTSPTSSCSTPSACSGTSSSPTARPSSRPAPTAAG